MPNLDAFRADTRLEAEEPESLRGLEEPAWNRDRSSKPEGV
jgi:hypothetical protein